MGSTAAGIAGTMQRVPPRVTTSLLGAAWCLAAACSGSDDSALSTTTAPPTFACISANQVSGLTTGTPVPVAREVLGRLAEDGSLPPEQREYYAEQRRALNDLPDSATVGSTLDGVHCTLD